MGTVIGTPPNAIAAGALASIGGVNFAERMIYGIPPAILLLAIAWTYLLLVYLGRNEWAYDSEGLIVLRGRRKSRIRARLPLDMIGQGCHIVIERGAPAVPYLVALVNLCVLANGGLPLHAAAFEIDGVGVVVTGWSKGGKTESLLAALDSGARYVGDEWVYLSEGGKRAIGVPEPIRVWDWYLDQLDTIRPRLSRGASARARVLSGAVGLVESAERARLGAGTHRLALNDSVIGEILQ